MNATDARFESEDLRCMARALQLAERGYFSTKPNPRVGCVITQNGAIVGEGFHYRAGGPHAEVNAIAAAGENTRGATAYVSLEPCCHQGRTPPCTDALIAAGVARVVYAAGDPNPKVAGSGGDRLRAAGVQVDVGVMAEQATAVNRGFFRRMAQGVPFVTVKLGMTLDAKIALESGASQWITGAAARADVQRLRAASGAVVTGVGTVMADNPALNVRDSRFDIGGVQPLRVVLDSRLRTPPSSQLFQVDGKCLIFTKRLDRAKVDALQTAGASIERCQARGEGLDISAVLTRLAEIEINDVLVESGPTLAGAFIREGLFDELIVYVAPKLFGDSARDGFILPAPFAVENARELEFVEIRQVESDLRITLKPRH